MTYNLVAALVMKFVGLFFDKQSEMAKEKKIYQTSCPVDRTEFSKFTEHFQILAKNTPSHFPR